jgi:hypothetical protein
MHSRLLTLHDLRPTFLRASLSALPQYAVLYAHAVNGSVEAPRARVDRRGRADLPTEREDAVPVRAYRPLEAYKLSLRPHVQYKLLRARALA